MEEINNTSTPNQPIETPIVQTPTPNLFKYLFIISVIVLLAIIVSFYFILNNKISKLSSVQSNNNNISQTIPTTIPTEIINQVIPTTVPTTATINQTQSSWIQEFTPVINPSKNETLTVTKVLGNYATGGISSGGGGVAWIAAKVNGKWQVVWTGNGDVDCKIVSQYNIPKEIYVVGLYDECSSGN